MQKGMCCRTRGRAYGGGIRDVLRDSRDVRAEGDVSSGQRDRGGVRE